MKVKHAVKKRISPEEMMTTVSPIFQGTLSQPQLEEYSAAHRHSDEQAFRFNELARHLPIAVKAEKTKQKRLSRFVKSKLPIAAMQEK